MLQPHDFSRIHMIWWYVFVFQRDIRSEVFSSLVNVMPTASKLLFMPFSRRDNTFG